MSESARWGVIAAACHTDEIHAEDLAKSKNLLGRYCIAKFAEMEEREKKKQATK